MKSKINRSNIYKIVIIIFTLFMLHYNEKIDLNEGEKTLLKNHYQNLISSCREKLKKASKPKDQDKIIKQVSIHNKRIDQIEGYWNNWVIGFIVLMILSFSLSEADSSMKELKKIIEQRGDKK